MKSWMPLVSAVLLLPWCACSSDMGPEPAIRIRTIGIPNNAPGQFHQISGTGADLNDGLYVTDAHRRVVKFTTDGRYVREIPLERAASSLDVSDAGDFILVNAFEMIKMRSDGEVVWKVGSPVDDGGDVIYGAADIAVGPDGHLAAVTPIALYRFETDGNQSARLPLPQISSSVALEGNGNAHVVGEGTAGLEHLVLSEENLLLRSDPIPCSGFCAGASGIDVNDDGLVLILTKGVLTRIDVEGSITMYPARTNPIDVEILPDGRAFLGFRDHVALVDEKGNELWRLGDRSIPGVFKNATDLATNGMGDLVVADNGNQRLQVFGPDGELERVATELIGPQVAIDDDGILMSPFGRNLAVLTSEGIEYIELYSDGGATRLVRDILTTIDEIIVALDDGQAASSGAEIIRISSSGTERFWVGDTWESVKGMTMGPKGDLIVALRPITAGDTPYLIRVSADGTQERIDLTLDSVYGVAASPAGDLFVTSRGTIYRLDGEGRVVGAFPLPDENAYCTTLTVSGPTLYALDENLDAVYAYSLPQ